MKDYKQNKDKNEKSLPKETCIKAINGEGHGAVAGNASAKNLNRNGSERLNRFALTQSYSAAKLQQNTETTKKKSKIDVLASLLDGKGFVDNLGIAEEKEYNFFGSL